VVPEMTRRHFFAVALAPVVAAVVRPVPLAFHPDAFRLVMDTVPTRVEVLYGWAVLRPELAARIIE